MIDGSLELIPEMFRACVFEPGKVKLTTAILQKGQVSVVEALGPKASLDLAFHGGFRSELEKIHETLEYGVVKMNTETDT